MERPSYWPPIIVLSIVIIGSVVMPAMLAKVPPQPSTPTYLPPSDELIHNLEKAEADLEVARKRLADAYLEYGQYPTGQRYEEAWHKAREAYWPMLRSRNWAAIRIGLSPMDPDQRTARYLGILE